jgi:hypothetical protein
MHPDLYQLGHRSHYGMEHIRGPWCQGIEPPPVSMTNWKPEPTPPPQHTHTQAVVFLFNSIHNLAFELGLSPILRIHANCNEQHAVTHLLLTAPSRQRNHAVGYSSRNHKCAVLNKQGCAVGNRRSRNSCVKTHTRCGLIDEGTHAVRQTDVYQQGTAHVTSTLVECASIFQNDIHPCIAHLYKFRKP